MTARRDMVNSMEMGMDSLECIQRFRSWFCLILAVFTLSL